MDGDECQRPPGMLETGTCKQWHSRSQHNILPNHPRQRGLEGKVGPPECGTGLREREYENRAGQGLCSSLVSNKTLYPGPLQAGVCGFTHDKQMTTKKKAVRTMDHLTFIVCWL